MARIVLLLTLILLTGFPVFAEGEVVSLVTPQSVEFSSCTKTFEMNQEKLFYLAIASANANKFAIEEIQSKTGYILFSVAGKQYLASVVKVNAKQSMLKITPTNNNYFFPPGVVSNFFKYIDLNNEVQMTTIPKI